jgi:hypothetical protein
MSIFVTSDVVPVHGALNGVESRGKRSKYMSAPVFAGTPAFSQDQKLTARELEQARLFLEQTHNYVVGATKGLSEAQWKFKPAPDQWSIAENLDHIVAVQERVLGPILDQVADAPAPAADRNNQLADAIVIHQFSTRLAKFPAPEYLRPLDQIAPVELLGRLSANYARFADRLESTPGWRHHVLESPPIKAVSQGAFDSMDGYQWILAAAAHTQRHTNQMLEVMANSGYPE